MDKIEQLKQQKQYEAYVKKKTPQHNVWFNMMKAFFLGGTICLIGQCIYHFCELKKLSPDDCSSWTSILLILLSLLLTGTLHRIHELLFPPFPLLLILPHTIHWPLYPPDTVQKKDNNHNY